MKQFEEAIKKYLDQRAAEDPQFAEKYANPKKTVAECCKFIVGEAFAKKENNISCLPDAEVYGLAVHYYDEDDIKIKAVPSGVRTVSKAPAEKSAPVLSDDDRKRMHDEALAEYKAKERAEIQAKAKEKARKKREAEKARKAAKVEAFNQRLAEDGDLFGNMGL